MAEKKLTVTLVRSAVTQVKKDQTATCRAMGSQDRRRRRPARQPQRPEA